MTIRQITEIQKMYQAGWTRREIADETGCTYRQIYDHTAGIDQAEIIDRTQKIEKHQNQKSIDKVRGLMGLMGEL